MSSDQGEEPEAPQTRRRSSRLSSQVNVAVLDVARKMPARQRGRGRVHLVDEENAMSVNVMYRTVATRAYICLYI